jgi:hypothetical protein
MSITRPTGDQVVFKSANTGTHVLDTYMEAAEIGGLALSELLGEIFDEDGEFNAVNFRLNEGWIEYQLGSGSWVKIADFNDLLTAVDDAETAKDGAETAQGLAEDAQADAETAKDAAEDAQGYAQEWANKAVSTPVSVDAGGDGATTYSAKHWATQAQASVTGHAIYRGTWDASGGTYPSSPSQGDLYRINVAGTLGGESHLQGDYIFYNGSAWDKWDNTEPQSVLKSGDTMTGHLNVPSGASGTQVPQAQEVVPATREVSTITVEEPSDGDYYLTLSSPIQVPVDAVRVVTSSGTCTVAVKHGSGPTTVATVSASTTANEDTTPSSTIPKGDAIYITISSASSVEGLEVHIIGAS